METVPPCATWGHTKLWWQGTTYHGYILFTEKKPRLATHLYQNMNLWSWSEITLGPSPVPPCSPQGRTLISLDLHHKVYYYVKNLGFNLNNYKEMLLRTNLLTKSNLLAVLFNVWIKYNKLPISLGDHGSTVVKVLRYKSQMVSLEFFIDIKFFRSHYDPASNRNEYQEHFLGVKAAGA